MFVKPNPDKKVNGKALEVYDPTRREFLPPEGRDVPRSSYWMRRIQTGDVIREDVATESKPVATGNKKQNSEKTDTKNTTKAKNPAAKQKNANKNGNSAKKPDKAATESKGE